MSNNDYFDDDLKTEALPVDFILTNEESKPDIHYQSTIVDEINMERHMAKKLTEFYFDSEDDDNSRTVGLYSLSDSVQPVVGWLVCEKGPEYGRSYVIVSGRNFVGRSHKSDIVIYDDQRITREKHCSIIYEPRTYRFYIMPSETSLTYINGKLLEEASLITESDVIGMGESLFRLIPYCKEGRAWN